MRKEQDNFGKRLKRLFPNMSEAEALNSLRIKYGGYRSIAVKIGVSIATISRWGHRVGTTPPPPFPHFQVIRSLFTCKGNTVQEKLYWLKKEKREWVKVAVYLHVTVRELKAYRYSVGMVPQSKWNERKNALSLWTTRKEEDYGDV